MASNFGNFGQFVAHLQELSCSADERKKSEWLSACDSAVDGDAEHYLAKLVSSNSRRQAGAFFTPSPLAARLALRITTVDRTRRLVDPAVGAGNLLIAAARRIGKARSVAETVERWSQNLAGLDEKAVFVHSARLRLWLLAHLLHSKRPNSLPEDIDFSAIQRSDSLRTPDIFSGTSHVLLNPPFCRIAAPAWYSCGRGKVNAAAIMSAYAAEHMEAGACLHAILPEVLRSGSNYAAWRDSMSRRCDVHDVVSYGLFDTADVDVFIASFTKRHSAVLPKSRQWSAQPTFSTNVVAVADLFEVSVGPVVDFRDPKVGAPRAYIHPRIVPTWKEVRRIGERRRYRGRLLIPPFVVLRRTSRPGDRWRAAASIILGTRPVAVENHFIVCQPITGTVGSCRALLIRLKTSAVNNFLDNEMRCRHLTTKVVGRIPL